jgi:hypothetical protein
MVNIVDVIKRHVLCLQNQSEKDCSAPYNDAALLLNELKKINDQRWVVDFSLDFELRLQNFMWMTPKMVNNYTQFVDVVVFITPQRKNRFNIPLGILIGIESNGFSSPNILKFETAE